MTNTTDKAMREALPCPFCGSDPRIGRTRDESLWSHDIVEKVRVSCSGCDVSTEYTEEGQEPEAIEVWNRRAALASSAAAPEQAEPVALREVGLTRDVTGLCVVTVNGREAIRDAGDVISHFATPDWFATQAQSAPAAEAVIEWRDDANGWTRSPHAPLSEPMAEGATSEALLDLAEPLRPLLTKPEHWGMVLAYARSVIAALSSPASSAGMDAQGWQLRAEHAERNWKTCRRWAIAGGAPVEKLGDDPATPWHLAATDAREGSA